MIWHFGDTPETPCFGAPWLFFDATDFALLTYDRAASCAVTQGKWQHNEQCDECSANVSQHQSTSMHRP
jgi:hypothetical protein